MKSCENCVHNKGCTDSVNYKSAKTCGKYENSRHDCWHCNCWDSDREGCKLPSCDMFYACEMIEEGDNNDT